MPLLDSLWRCLDPRSTLHAPAAGTRSVCLGNQLICSLSCLAASNSIWNTRRTHLSGLLECTRNLGILLGDDRSRHLVQTLKVDHPMLMDAQACIHSSSCSWKALTAPASSDAEELVCPASTAIIAFTHSCMFLDCGPLTPYLTGLQAITGMMNAMNLVCQARTALADSIRQTAGWLGHTSAQSTSTAKLMQVSQLYLNIAQ